MAHSHTSTELARPRVQGPHGGGPRPRAQDEGGFPKPPRVLQLERPWAYVLQPPPRPQEGIYPTSPRKLGPGPGDGPELPRDPPEPPAWPGLVVHILELLPAALTVVRPTQPRVEHNCWILLSREGMVKWRKNVIPKFLQPLLGARCGARSPPEARAARFRGSLFPARLLPCGLSAWTGSVRSDGRRLRARRQRRPLKTPGL